MSATRPARSSAWPHRWCGSRMAGLSAQAAWSCWTKPQPSWVYAVPMYPPSRIVCLTEETVETLYLLGEERRIVGVSGYAVRPPRVRREKPRVSAFISADVPKILALDPDLVLTFSDLQADLVAELFPAA